MSLLFEEPVCMALRLYESHCPLSSIATSPKYTCCAEVTDACKGTGHVNCSRDSWCPYSLMLEIGCWHG